MQTFKYLCVVSAMMVFTVSSFACDGSSKSKEKEKDKRVEITRTVN